MILLKGKVTFMKLDIVERGWIGKIEYELRCDASENVCEVILFQDGMGLPVARNTGRVACEALIAGMKIGKCRNIHTAAKKNLEFTEYGEYEDIKEIKHELGKS